MGMLDGLILLKTITAASLVTAASLAQRRWGARVAGVIVGLPLTAGPVSLFFSMEQGTAFAAEAAVGTLLGVVPLAAFCLAYSRAASEFGWLQAEQRLLGVGP